MPARVQAGKAASSYEQRLARLAQLVDLAAEVLDAARDIKASEKRDMLAFGRETKELAFAPPPGVPRVIAGLKQLEADFLTYYLAWEREQQGKHEYHLGAVFAMAGGSPRHNLLAAAAGAELRAALRGKGCHVLSSDQRVAASPGERYVYADAVVVCGGATMDPLAGDVLANPAVVVEVLSPSTEAYDRGEKWEADQRIPSLSDYLLVAQRAARIEHYRREADGSWRYRVLGAGDHVTLASGASVAVDAVYEGAFEIAGG